MLFSQYPYQNFSDYNLDWIIYKINEVKKQLSEFVLFNSIKYADPISWNISKQYEANTVVIDPLDGTAYISVKPVPNGVNIDNEDYWTPIFNYGESLKKLQKQIVALNEERNTTASQNINKNTLFWLNGYLCRATENISQGNAFVENGNYENVTVEEIINSSVYANVYSYGAVGDGTTDDSTAFQNAVNSGKTVYVPAGTYVVSGVVTENSLTIKGADGAIIIPKYVNDIAQNVFTFRNCDNGKIENIKFIGQPKNGHDLNVKRQSTVEAVNMVCFELDNVAFITIDNSETSIEPLIKNRKGIAFTSHDVNHTILNHVTFDGNSRDETCWISPQQYKGINEIFIDVNNCHSRRHGGWSIIDAIAYSINLFRFISENTDNTNGASYMNLLCKNVLVKQCYFFGRYLEIIDNRESNAFFGDSVVFEDCVLTGFTSMASILFASRIVFKRCTCVGRCLVQSVNNPTTDPTVINAFGELAYTSYKQIEEILIEDCSFTADNTISGTKWISMIYADNVGGDVFIKRTIIDSSNISGSIIWLQTAKLLSVSECTFKNGINILGSTTIIAYSEIKNNVSNIIFSGNISDHMLCAILGTNCNEVIVKENIVDALFTGYIADNFGEVYKVGKAITDTNQVRLYAENYTTNNASYSVAPWTATESEAVGTELTQRLSLKRGVYFVTCSLPVFSKGLPVRFRNFTKQQDFGALFVASTYGTFSTVLSSNVDCEIGVVSQGSTAITITAITNANITAVQIK